MRSDEEVVLGYDFSGYTAGQLGSLVGLIGGNATRHCRAKHPDLIEGPQRRWRHLDGTCETCRRLAEVYVAACEARESHYDMGPIIMLRDVLR